VFTLGCTAQASEGGAVEVAVATDTAEPAIFGGDRDDDDRAYAGVVALRVGVSGTFELCTGALVAPNVVLTARHCVTKNTTASVSCDENGRSANGPHVVGDEAPATIGVFTGPTPSLSRRPAAFGRAIVAPQGAYLCDADIALVVLDRALDVAVLPVRLEAKAQAGEAIRAVGYGQNDAGLPIGTRFRREGVVVLGQGKGLSASKTPLGEHEFEVGRSICQGDSGGPAISATTGAIVGVVSRGGKCDDDFGHIYTTTAGFEAMFDQAFRIAGGAPVLESQAQLQSVRTSLATNEAAEGDRGAGAGACAASGPLGNGNVNGSASSPRGALGSTAALALVLGAARARRARRARRVELTAGAPVAVREHGPLG
jgi:hypothetical protein